MTREEAIEELKAIRSAYSDKKFHEERLMNSEEQALEMAIKALSQEPTVTSTDEPMTIIYPTIVCDDAISREAVLSIIDGWYEQNRETENIEDLIILITYMASVTPKSRECEDVISRAEVKKIVDFYKEQYDGIYHINESIDKIPSVTQKSKTGHWIVDEDRDDPDRKWDRRRFYCSECGRWQTYGATEYCMHCGADMRGAE